MPRAEASFALRNPKTGYVEVFAHGDEVPGWAADQVTDGPVIKKGRAKARPEEPPKAGPGSGAAAWRDYAEQIGVEVPEDASRDEIINAVS